MAAKADSHRLGVLTIHKIVVLTSNCCYIGLDRAILAEDKAAGSAMVTTVDPAELLDALRI